METVKLGWALHNSGRMIHINDSVRGKNCNCSCPDCGGVVIARQGEINAWCFSHSVDTNCNGEGILHRVAKQVIEDCASNGDYISLPCLMGIVSATDYRGRLIEEEWVIPSEDECLQSAKKEVSIRPDLRADILAIIGSKNTAIEICVTHKKSEIEIEKYATENFTCLELYLYGLAWDSSYQEIKLALLKSAPRAWIYHQSVKGLIAEANERLQKRLSEIELIDRTIIIDFANLIVSKGKFYLDYFNWPSVSGSFKSQDFGQGTEHSATRIPRITKFVSSVVIDGDAIWASGSVNDKTIVSIYFVSKHKSSPIGMSGKAALIIWIEMNSASKILPSNCKLQWINIHSWVAKLDEEARAKFLLAKQKDDRNNKNFDAFKEVFKAKSNKEKIDFLSSKIGLSPPTFIGKVSPHWNASWSIWKALVWYYSIEKRRGYRINIEFIAEWHWLAEILEWPRDPYSTELRRKNIWFWFKELSTQNVLLHDGGLNFFVMDNLPCDVTPWSKQLVRNMK